MDMESALSRLETVLREERDAIVRFDTTGLDRFTEEKLTLVAALRDGSPPTPALMPRFAALKEDLRHNLSLLSHGRACLREAIATLTSTGGAARPGLRVHVTG